MARTARGVLALLGGTVAVAAVAAPTWPAAAARGHAPSPVIVTVAGGVGAGAATNVAQNPYYMAFHDSYLYLSDYDDSVVRVIDLTSGDEEVIAGNGLTGTAGDGGPAVRAEVAQPAGIAFDGFGNLYVGDEGDQSVRVIALSPTPPVFPLAGAACSPTTTPCTWTVGDIYRVAGTGKSGYSGDGGPALSAALDDPTGIAFDAQGDLFIADQLNGRVREVASHNGADYGIPISVGDMYTVAGNGMAANPQAYDGVDPGSAAVGYPQGISVDGQGDLIVGEDFNNQASVVEIAAASQYRYGITMQPDLLYTVAGNPGTTVCGSATDTVGDGCPALRAQLTDPSGQAVDSSGNLFTVDYYDERIREVAASNGLISTVAGNGSPGYPFAGPAIGAVTAYPTDLAFGPSGGLYVADSDGVARIDLSAGTIAPVAGTPIIGNESGDGGTSVDAELNDPQGVATDSAGDVFVADTGNNVVREIAATSHLQFGISMSAGDIYRVAGNGADLDRGDGGSALASAVGAPLAVASDTAGDLFIASGIGGVRMVAAKDGTFFGQTMAAGDIYSVSSAVPGLDPAGLAADPAGDLFVTNAAADQVGEIFASGGGYSVVAGSGVDGSAGDGGPATSAALSRPTSLAYGTLPGGHPGLYIADTGNNRVQMVDLTTGIVSTVAGNGIAGDTGDGKPAVAAELSANAVAVDPSGNLFIADEAHYVVREVWAATGDITTVIGTYGSQGTPGEGDGGPPGAALLSGPQGLAVDPAGDLFVADYLQGSTFGSGPNVAGSRVREVSAGGNPVSATTTSATTAAPPTSTTTAVAPSPSSTVPTSSTSTVPTSSTTAVPTSSTTAALTSPPGPGYWMLDSGGTVYNFGSAPAYGSATGLGSAAAMAARLGGGGYWVVSPYGFVDAFGSAATYPLSAGVPAGSAVVSIASTADGKGYWLATNTGAILTAGDAVDYGSPLEQGIDLAAPIVNLVATADGYGYWMLGADGGVFTYGDARYFGSPGQLDPALPPGGANSAGRLVKPAVAMAPTGDDRGYWFVAADGGIFAFGDAGYFGSTSQLDPFLPPGGANSIAGRLAKPIDGMVPTADGRGYWMVAADGGVFAYGDAGFVGSLGADPPWFPVVSMAAS